MLFKLNYLFPTFARQRVEKKVSTKTSLSHEDWIKIDRIVMALLFLLAIVGAVVFS